METRNLDELKANSLNPRTVTRDEQDALEAALAAFGDLGAIVYNKQLDRLVGGHARVRAFKKMGGAKNVVITQEFKNEDGSPKPNDVGTVAVGYITYNGEFYPYREVMFDEATDLAANVAANRIGGDFDLEKLANVNSMILEDAQGEALLKLTGQNKDDLERLAQLGSEPEDDKPAKDDNAQTFRFNEEQAELVDEALGYVLAKHEVTSENSDIRANAFAFICRDYLDRLHGLTDTE